MVFKQTRQYLLLGVGGWKNWSTLPSLTWLCSLLSPLTSGTTLAGRVRPDTERVAGGPMLGLLDLEGRVAQDPPGPGLGTIIVWNSDQLGE